jgi:hypothetical protein
MPVQTGTLLGGERMAKTDGISRRDAIRTAGMASAAAAVATFASSDPADAALPAKWDRTADVVVIGSGAAGMLAALAARDGGSSVIVIEANKDIGGHAICSGGHLALGGGTSRQQKYGVADSPDLVFRDLTDWSVVEPNGAADYRFNDREIIRAFADNCAATFEFIAARGVVFVDKAPDTFGGASVGNSMPRENHCAVMNWPTVQTGRPLGLERQATTASAGTIRPANRRSRVAGSKSKGRSARRRRCSHAPSAMVMAKAAERAASAPGKSMDVTPLKAAATRSTAARASSVAPDRNQPPRTPTRAILRGFSPRSV